MAQTKRKRRTKHRGNAAGVVESRGRTGRRPTEEELRKSSGGGAPGRRVKPPSWNSAFLKSALMAALLFLFTRIGLFGDEVPVSQSLVLCAFALLLYTPLAYVTDRWVYNRDQRRRQQQKSG
jgi:hypothetical protein